ncbi:MAG TPA: hypothetical protein PKH07_10090, partial [bacterium]|nr:hypothetical protein [bacterium]
MKKLLLVIALTLCVSVSYGAMTLPLEDNFNAGGPDHTWDFYGGTYSAAGSGTHIMTGFNGRDCLAVDDGSGYQLVFPHADEGTQSAQVMVEAWQYIPSNDSGTTWARIGVGCRVKGTGWADARDSGYWVYADTDSDNYFTVGVCFRNWVAPG